MMKKFLLVLPLFLITSGMSYAVELPSVMKQTMAQDPIGMPGMVNLVLSMVIVIALIYATGWIYTKLNIINKDKLKKITSSQNDKERFSVLQSMPLGQQRHLYSIEMNNKIHGEEAENGKPELRFASFGYRKSKLSSSDFLYNGEQALRSVIKRAYFSYEDEYLKFEELPAGDGCADIVYFPKKDSMLTALVIELKWNKRSSFRP